VSRQPYVWIVEMWNDDQARWEATVGARLTREAAQDEIAEWRERNPYQRFRVHRYVAEGSV
jgi:hypothetical protein